MDTSAFHRFASVMKTHGIHGQLILRLQTKSITLEPDEPVFLLIEGGLVPFFVASFEQTGEETAILQLQEVNSDKLARSLKGTDIYIDPAKHHFTETREFSPDDFSGYTIVDKTTGIRAEVLEFVDIPKNPLLRVRMGKKEWLIPLQEEMILGIDAGKKVIRIQAPEGLFSLDD